jgi:error-prone DNA polymerase
METTGPEGMDFQTGERPPLPEAGFGDELAAAYSVQGFSASSHVMALFRARLVRMGALTSAGLAHAAPGAAVKAGGYNVCLQVPPTAKGFAFITLEDEEGLMNVVLRPDVYRAHRTLVRLEPLLFVEGVVEKKDGVINVTARRLAPLRDVAGGRPPSADLVKRQLQ